VEPILAEINANDIDAVIVQGRSPRVDAPSIAQEVGQTIPLGSRVLHQGVDEKYAFIERNRRHWRSRCYAKCWKSVPADIISADNEPHRPSRAEM
jgi:hypothetical protein